MSNDAEELRTFTVRRFFVTISVLLVAAEALRFHVTAFGRFFHGHVIPVLKRSFHVRDAGRPSPVVVDDVPDPCSADCQRFQHRLRHDWPLNRPKAAIYYLIGSRRPYGVHDSLASLDRHFNSQFDYPVIVFHEADLADHINHIKSFTNSTLYFQMVSFRMPSFINGSAVPAAACGATIGYRHMCRFQARGVYGEEILRGLDYVWRLDDDSLLLRPIGYDLFDFMRRHELIYGYIFITWERRVCTRGLWMSVDAYIRNRTLTTQFYSRWRRNSVYYNNFEVSKLDLWMSAAYQDYVDHVDRLGGIYFSRWGDAPVKSIAVSMFVPKEKTHHFQDIAYRHQAITVGF